jgi:hypothetical protein
MTDSYLDMIRKFPLRPIRNEAECDEATRILDKNITRNDMDSGQEDYIMVLAGLVGDYEDKHHPVDTSHVTPLGMLKHLMEENDHDHRRRRPAPGQQRPGLDDPPRQTRHQQNQRQNPRQTLRPESGGV